MTTETDVPPREAARLEALRRYSVLDTGPEPAYDRVVRLAARLFRAPTALISFMDAERQWFKARVGVDFNETPRAEAFCNITVERRGLCSVGDARRDPRFAESPFVLGNPNIRFYAGVPLLTPDGHALGSLCVMDTEPRTEVSAEEHEVLRSLAAIVIDELELRRELAARQRETRHSELRGRLLEATAGAGGFRAAIDGTMSALGEATGARISLLYRLAPDGTRLQFLGGHARGGILDERYLARLRAIGLTLQHSACGQAISSGTQLVFAPVDEALQARYPGMRLNAEHGCVGQIVTPIIVGDEKYAMASGFGEEGDLATAKDLLQEAASAMRPLLRRLRDLEETELFRRASEASDDAVIIGGTDHVAGQGPTIRYVNEAFLRQTGWTRAEVIGQRTSLHTVGGPDFDASIREEMLQGRIVHREALARRRDGSTFWAEVSIAPLFDSAGWITHWVAIRRDVTARKMEALALAESEASFRHFFEQHPAPMWVYDKETLRFLEVNRTAVTEYGWSREEFLRMTTLDIRPEEDHAAATEAMFAERPGFRQSGPWRHRTKSGEIRYVQIRSQFIEFRGRPVRIVAVWNLTELVEAEKAAQELAADLRATFESIDDGFFTLDHEWRFAYVNDTAERLLRKRRPELLGRRIWDLWPDVLATEVEERFRRVAGTRRTERFDFHYPAYGAWFAIAVYPSRGGLTVWFRDATEHRRAQMLLEEQAQMLAQARDAILVRDLDHRILYWNRSAERIYGWTREEALGRRVVDLIYVEPEAYLAANDLLLEDGFWDGRLEQRRKDGMRLMVDANWTLLRAENGTVRGVLAVNADVTERVALEGKLRQSQRMEAVGQLTGGIAHDFNNLLTVILGNAEMLMDSLERDEGLRALAGTVVSAAERGAELTRRLLAFSRRQALAPRTVDVNQLLASLVQMLRRTLGGQVELAIMAAPGLWNALIDAPQLENAVLNLCLNARDAMPDGGRLVIETENVTFDGEHALAAEILPGEYVMVAVSDTGTGMPPEVVAQAFEPFFTTKEVGAGSGLGLSMVYGFVKQSGGHVKIYSEPGQGTTVRMYIPRAAAPGARVPAQPEAERLPGGTEHILLAEDDPLVRAHAVRQLRGLGYRVTVAASGVEALDALHRAGDVDLLFTDVVMPGGMNGQELAREAQRRRPGLPVLFTSGYTENAIMQQGRLEPGVLLLQKPYRRRDLAEKVRQALAGAGC